MFPIEVMELRASPKQLAFQKAFFDRVADGRRKDIFVALGANRSGKSIVAGWLCFAKYLRYHARAGDVFWCIGVSFDRSVGGVQKELWQALPRWMFADQQWDEKIGFGMHRKIVLPCAGGGRCLVEFRSADQAPETFEQAKLSGVWADERLPEEVYNRLLPRIIDRDGWILYSDIPEQYWHHERLINAASDAGVHWQHFAMADNAHNLPEGAIAKASARMTEDERKMRVLGLMVVMSGIVFRQFRDYVRAKIEGEEREGNLVEPFEIPEEWPRWRLIDYGSSAPTACLWVALSPTEKAYIYREYYQRDLSIQANARAILAMSTGPDGRPEKYRATLIDPHAVDKPPAVYGSSPSVAEQYAAAGIPALGWPFVNVMGEHAMVERVKYRVENLTLKVFTSCPENRREFRVWKYKLDKEGRPLAADAYENDNNHTLDCVKGWLGTSPVFTPGKVEVYGGN